MADLPVGLRPLAVAVRAIGGGDLEAWVVNHLSDSVSVVRLSTGNVVATLETDDEPGDVVFAGSPVRAFVSCSAADRVLVFEPDDLGRSPRSVDGEWALARAWLRVELDGERAR